MKNTIAAIIVDMIITMGMLLWDAAEIPSHRHRVLIEGYAHCAAVHNSELQFAVVGSRDEHCVVQYVADRGHVASVTLQSACGGGATYVYAAHRLVPTVAVQLPLVHE